VGDRRQGEGFASAGDAMADQCLLAGVAMDEVADSVSHPLLFASQIHRSKNFQARSA
jgi:hypothetical protein